MFLEGSAPMLKGELVVRARTVIMYTVEGPAGSDCGSPTTESPTILRVIAETFATG